MDASLRLRIAKVVEHAQGRLADDPPDVGDFDARRAAHDKVIADIPAALARLAGAVAEANDAVADAHLHLKLEPSEEPPTIEASFAVSLWPTDECERGLVFNVNHDGRLIVLLSSRQSRTRLKAAPIAEADRTFFLDALVSLLEAAI